MAKLLADDLGRVVEDFRHVADDFCHVAEVFSQQFQPQNLKLWQ